jgi:general secretion pathway protein E
VVSRIKILARMNIAERRLPQDGQFTFRSGGKAVDVRVASIETAHGERVVMRILDKDNSLMALSDLGFAPDSLAQYQSALRMPHGLVLVSGPTGSGKTTTLYASLNAMDRNARNVVTVEDPIEYKFADINQIQVNTKAELTFAAGLRALMRHDPDVILVGEIRDQETAKTAVQAALTGHLVLSSIHANDTEGVIYRLMHLGVEPFLVASALTGVVAQRMVRRVCTKCATQRDASAEERSAYQQELQAPGYHFTEGRGCQSCANTGYRGRIGAFEVMTVSENIRSLILARPEPGVIKQQAMKEGMVPLLRDGLIKAKQGLTTPAEVLRNLYTLR